jgi:hypothetical protein
VAALGVEPLDGLDEAYVALLDQVFQRYPGAAVPDRHRYDQPQVPLYERAAGEPVPGTGLSAELDLLPVRQEGVPGNAPQIRRQRAER